MTNYLSRSMQITLIFFAVITAINAFACVWMILSPKPELAFWDQYNIAWYWAVTTLTTVGYGDVVPHNNIARIFTMFTMMMGVSSFALIITNLSRLFMLRDRYKEQSKNKMNSLHELMNFYHIPVSVRREVSHFYHHTLEKKIAEDDIALLKELPMPLQHEFQIYMKVKLMKEIHVFKTLSVDCLKMVAEKLDEKYYSPGQMIVGPGGESSEMYLISHGEVEITRNNVMVAQLKSGSIFGEMSLIQNTKRSALIVSKNYSDIFILRKDAYLEICQKHPQLHNAMMELYRARQYENSMPKKAA